MTVLSLTEAAAATGLNKTTVLRSIKSGKLSGARDPLGQWRIDAAELHRVYPPIADATAAKTHSAAPYASALADAQRRAELAEARLGELRGTLADMRAQRDAWQTQAERLALPPASQRSWWNRITG